MTIDEKIKQAAEAIADVITIDGRPLVNTERSSFIFGFYQGEQYAKSEMLADMQKLAEALEFYADESSWSISETYKQFNRIDDQDLEYKPGCGRYDLLAGKKARQALAEFNAKYKGEK